MHKESVSYNINVTTGSLIRAALFVVLILFLYFIRDIVLVILAAVVIASALEPATKWFGRYKIRRLPAAAFMYIAVGLVLAGFFIFFLPTLLRESIGLLNTIPTTFNISDLWSPLRDTGIMSGSGLGSALPNQTFSVADMIGGLRAAISGTSGGAFKTASIIFGGALSLFLIIILSFYLTVQEDGIASFLRIVSPVKSHDYVINLWKRSQVKIGQWLQGQLLLGLIIGVLVYLGLMVLGIEHALLLACLAAVFELIPVFGPIFSAIPAVLVAFTAGGLSKGLLVLGLYLIIHQFENNLLYPLVVKKIVGISPILVILALVIGAKLAGFLGAILSVPIASALTEYVNDIEKNKRREIEPAI